MATPRKKIGVVKYFRITLGYGGDTYTIIPLDPDPAVASKAFRLRKHTGDRRVHDVRLTGDGAECGCPGFTHSRRCEHCDMLRAARMLD
jgi:hypothetical protein